MKFITWLFLFCLVTPAYAFDPYNVYQEYQISASTSASTALLLGYDATVSGPKRIQIEASGGRIVFKFGSSTVSADATVTSSALGASNFSISAGAIVDITLPSDTENKYVSVDMASGTGTAIVRLLK